MKMRVGFGYDSHVFSEDEDRLLKLGGVVFSGERGLKGHSDADVLVHAIIDALLGAAAAGDIGQKFPDTDDKWKNADSINLLNATVAEISSLGYRIENIDVTVICERPRLRPHIDEIRRSLAAALHIDVGCVSVKGKTNEKMDVVGRGLGIESHCVVLLEKS
jgi:2-C-methyl-D-erythritol 2,4-cyclodiphosphate synthase